MKLNKNELTDLVLSSFQSEQNSDYKKGTDLIHTDFKVTEMSEWYDGTIFKSLEGKEVRDLMEQAFEIKGRKYKFEHVIADEQTQTVIVEFVESYPDEKTGKVYRTPQIAVCEVKDGKIYRTRHYNDPRLSYKYLSEEIMDKAFN